MTRLAPLAMLIGVIGAAHGACAEELTAGQGYSVHLASVSGIVYFEQQGTEDRLVATLSSDPNAAPVRFVASLADQQSATVSVPQNQGEPALEVVFTRHGDHVTTSKGLTVLGRR